MAQIAMKPVPYWADDVAAGKLPPVDQRIPEHPLVVDMAQKGRTTGAQGGTLHTMVTRDKDIRQMVVYGYARLVGYDEQYNLVPDILESVENIDDTVITLHLRPGHKWSNGDPFTSEDFRYWWEDVANNEELSPSGPPDFLIVNDKLPAVTFPDETTVVFEWDAPNPDFLQTLALASPPFIYRPAKFLKQYHAKYAEDGSLQSAIVNAKASSWAALHNKLDNMYKFDNPELPTLQPWVNADTGNKIRHRFVRNPYYHRIDSTGQQLPYIDAVEMEIVAGGLVAAKSYAGEVDLQGRGLDFADIPVLKKGEKENGTFKVLLWPTGVASQLAIYPNLNVDDPVWREVLRKADVRRALSLGIDRPGLNKALFFNLAVPGAMTVLPESPMFQEKFRESYAVRDVEKANALLDAAGLDKKGADGIRLLPDGRPMEIVIETAGERQEEENALQIITDNWKDIGVKLVMRPLDRDILRNRVYAGTSMASTWYGWDNGLPQPFTSPSYLAPMQQDFQAWPKWGQYYQTGGTAGEAPDMPEAIRLMELADAWEKATSDEERFQIWTEMLAIHADQLYGIGTVNEAPQPIVVSNRLRNVPERGMWAWDPGAHFGVHRMDEFYFADGE
nr:ABC transporter substrate-binding protein [Chachezhania sediminis]